MSNFWPKKWSGSLGTLQESNSKKPREEFHHPPPPPLHHGGGMICLYHAQQITKQQQQNTHTLQLKNICFQFPFVMSRTFISASANHLVLFHI